MLKPGSYAFRQTESLPYLTLDSIGWHSVQSESYMNDGHSRTDHGHVIFQYTLSGEGIIAFEDRSYVLSAGNGFLLKVPSQHQYYYNPKQAEPWEFIWLNVKGEDAVRMWDRMIDRRGRVLTLSALSLPVQRWWDIYRTIAIEHTSEPATLSSLVYNWVLAMLTPDSVDSVDSQSSSLLQEVKRYMKEHYLQNPTLEDIAEHCGISRAYLCRLIRKKENDTPIQYMRRRKIESAVTMLRRSALSIQEIGEACGFDSPSYFSKVFKSYIGVTPSEYRLRSSLGVPYNQCPYESDG